MQAQQLGAVSYGGQPQLLQHLSSMIAAQDTAGLAASMAAYPDAYQQLLTGMLSQQSMAAVGQNPMLSSVPAAPVAAPASHVQPPSALNAYGVPGGQSLMGQYPQGLGSVPIDMSQFVAARVAAAAAAANNEHIGDHRMPQSSAVDDSLAYVPNPYSMQGIPSGNSLAAGMAASNWGWGSVNDMQGMESLPEMYLAPQAQFRTAQQGVGGAAGFGPAAGLPLPSGGEHWCVPTSPPPGCAFQLVGLSLSTEVVMSTPILCLLCLSCCVYLAVSIILSQVSNAVTVTLCYFCRKY